MRDTAGSAAAPATRRKNVRRNIFMRGGGIVSLLSPLAQRALLPSIRHPSVAEEPARDARVPLVATILRNRLLVPELVRRRPVRQLEQQRGADIVGAVGRADRSAENEAVAVRGEVRLVRVEMRAEELRRAGLGSRAEELLQALAAIVGRAL